MRKLDNVTLLCLDTRDPDGAVWAMQKCMSDLQFAEVVLLTHGAYKTADARIMVKPVEMLRNIDDYSRFMIKDIGKYFATSHVLVVQWDGFVVNPDLWDDDFLNYDYIGAPWANQRHAVGNGGFSLRSRKLVDALQDPEVKEFNPEDYAICDRYHDLLVERYGINFAPVSLAHEFSCETNRPPGPSFGVHGLGSLHWVMSDEEHLAQLKSIPERLLLGTIGRTIAKDCICTNKPLSAEYIISLRFAKGTTTQKIDAVKLKLKRLLGHTHASSKQPSILKKWFKHYVQRNAALFFSGQSFLQKDHIPRNVKKVLWCYDWHRLGDLMIEPMLRDHLSSNYEIDILTSGCPTESFEQNSAIRNVYSAVKECPKKYDLILLNDINSRSLRMKTRRFFSIPWSVIIQSIEQDPYRDAHFVNNRLEYLFNQNFSSLKRS